MNGVPMPGVSAGSNHVGASVTCTAHVICPSGAASTAGTATRSAPGTTIVMTTTSAARILMAPPLAGDSARELFGDVGEPLELLEIVVAGGQDHVLDPGRLQITDALDDVARGPEEVRLLQVLERPVRAHHALEHRALQGQRLVAVVRVDQVGEVEVPVAQAIRIPADLREVIANCPHVVLDHLLAAGR